MIITALAMFAVAILSFFMSLIPNMKMEFTPQGQESLFSVMQGVGALLPVNQLGIILGIILVVYAAEFLWLLLNWLIAKIPFIE